MKILIRNNTDSIAYVAIVNFDEGTQSIEEPIIFKLEPNEQAWCESTSSYFLGVSINFNCKYRSGPSQYNLIDLITTGPNSWYYSCSTMLNLEGNHETKLSDNSDDSGAIWLNNCMFYFLTKRYKLYDSSLDIKIPEE